MASKRDYELIATIISETKDEYGEPYVMDLIEHIAEELSDYFRHDNPKFNPNKFFKACGLPDLIEDEKDVRGKRR